MSNQFKGVISLKVLGKHRYEVLEEINEETGIVPFYAIGQGLLTLTHGGRLTIHPGYVWDGASGPAIDTANSQRASVIHDATYGLIKKGYIDKSKRIEADRLFRRLLIESGMWRIRAWYWYLGVRLGGGNHV